MKTLLLLFVLCISETCFSQWTPTTWQNESLITINCVQADTIILGTNDSGNNNGYLLSTNNGSSWQDCGNGIPYGSPANSALIIDSNIFLGGFKFLYLSKDLCKSWKKIPIGSFDSPIVNSVLPIGKTIFAAIDGGVYLTNDLGESWIEKDEGITIGKGHGRIIAYKFAKIDNNIFLNTATGIYITTNLGERWLPRNTGLDTESYKKQLVVMGHNLFIGTNEDTYNGSINDLYLSTDFGDTWIKRNNSIIAKEYSYILTTIGNKLLISNQESLFVSLDSGNTWSNVTEDLPYELQQGIISFGVFENNIYAASYSNLFISDDFGISWQPVRLVNNYSSIETMITKNSDIFVGTLHYNGMITSRAGLFKSTDLGETFIPLGLENYWVPSVCVSGNNLIAGTNHGVLISSDSGENWLVPDGLPQGIIVSLYVDDNEYVFASSGKGIYFSSDNGLNWELRNNGFNKSYWAKSIASSGNYIIAGLDSGVWISQDLGLNWYEKNNGLPENDRNALFVGTYGDTFFMGTRDNLYRSTDNGESWELKKEGLPQYDLFVNSIAIYEDYIFIATGRGIYFSSDNGETWIPKSEGIVNIDGFFTSIVISGDYIFTGTNGAGFGTKGDKIYKAKISDLITDVKENPKKEEFSIYPNPVIDFLYFSKYVKSDKIEIISALGIIVMECKYLDKIDVSSLNSGLYFLKVGDRITKFIKY